MYMSPQLCLGLPYDHKADVWSLGCVLFEMATLRPAFTAQNMGALVAKIKRAHTEQEVPGAYSVDLRHLIGRLLAFDPRDRPSVDDILSLPLLRGALETVRALREATPVPSRAVSTSHEEELCVLDEIHIRDGPLVTVAPRTSRASTPTVAVSMEMADRRSSRGAPQDKVVAEGNAESHGRGPSPPLLAPMAIALHPISRLPIPVVQDPKAANQPDAYRVSHHGPNRPNGPKPSSTRLDAPVSSVSSTTAMNIAAHPRSQNSRGVTFPTPSVMSPGYSRDRVKRGSAGRVVDVHEAVPVRVHPHSAPVKAHYFVPAFVSSIPDTRHSTIQHQPVPPHGPAQVAGPHARPAGAIPPPVAPRDPVAHGLSHSSGNDAVAAVELSVNTISAEPGVSVGLAVPAVLVAPRQRAQVLQLPRLDRRASLPVGPASIPVVPAAMVDGFAHGGSTVISPWGTRHGGGSARNSRARLPSIY